MTGGEGEEGKDARNAPPPPLTEPQSAAAPAPGSAAAPALDRTGMAELQSEVMTAVRGAIAGVITRHVPDLTLPDIDLDFSVPPAPSAALPLDIALRPDGIPPGQQILRIDPDAARPESSPEPARRPGQYRSATAVSATVLAIIAGTAVWDNGRVPELIRSTLATPAPPLPGALESTRAADSSPGAPTGILVSEPALPPALVAAAETAGDPLLAMGPAAENASSPPNPAAPVTGAPATASAAAESPAADDTPSIATPPRAAVTAEMLGALDPPLPGLAVSGAPSQAGSPPPPPGNLSGELTAPAPQAAAPATATAALEAPPEPVPAASQTVADANGLIESGDVTAGRAVLLKLKNHSETAEIALALARSYDPNILDALARSDAKPDRIEAERWYRRWYDLSVQSGLVSNTVPLQRLIKAMQ